MIQARAERRLAAIFAADVVGYSCLMAGDEDGTHARLMAVWKDLVEPLIDAYRGRLVRLLGDGVLVEFASAVDAVECAVAIQQAIGASQAEVPEDRRINLRIGINIGDIISDGGDIYGGGVNLAKRLEAVAEPGGISVSRTVYNHVHDKVTCGFAPTGEHRLKNIREPLVAYRVTAERSPAAGARGSRLSRKATWAAALGLAAGVVLVVVLAGGGPRPLGTLTELVSSSKAAWDLPAEPSIAVLPFANLINDPAEEYFVDGITSDIITDLSKFSTLFVIAANSTFHYKGQAVKVRDVARELGVRYVLEGSVQRADGRLSINAQLIDAVGGQHVWAERYDRPASDFFAVQKEITRNIAGVIGSENGGLQQAELRRIAHGSTDDSTAYDFFLRGVAHDERETKEDNRIARRMFADAVEADPGFARALAELSDTYLQDVWGNWAESREQALLQAEDLARRAIAVDRHEPLGYAALGFVYQLRGRNDQAIPLIERAHELNPNDYAIKYMLGYAYAYAGSPEHGVELLEEAHRLNPWHPEVSTRNLAQAYFFAGRYDDAIATLSTIAARHRTSYWLYLAASHAQLDQVDQAKAAIAEALALDPSLTLAGELRQRVANGLASTNVEHLRTALRKAGLPG